MMTESPVIAEPYGKKNPFPSTVLEVKHITQEASPKESIHISFDLTNSGLEYVAGDALAVIPTNDEKLVFALIETLALSQESPVLTPDGGTTSLVDALTQFYDITNVNKALLTKWATLSGNSSLQEMLATGDKQLMSDFCYGRDVLDLATEFPIAELTAEAFVGMLKKIMPRLYSIASSPNAHPGQVQLCVGAVRYTTRERKRGGVCSTFMADRVGQGGTAKVFVHTNKNFRLPEDTSLPIIMVGPGTGIAPFRAFWEERIVSGATGQNWLFFGNPYKATDFCYEDELLPLTQSGKLKLSTAWSRDQERKIYVQHLMEQEGETLWQWLEQGACFYVCGDASRMAKDVDNALVALVAKWGQKSLEDAVAYVDAMRKDKRYQRDVY
ncbi:MAG: sulfite reductase subunit alpha [Akkermansia sp.]